jgi:hypothetical protein
MRNLTTALDSLEADDFAYQVAAGETTIEHYGLSREGERVIAIWLPGRARDHCEGIKTDIMLAGEWDAVVYDCLNGTACPLNVRNEGGETVMSGLLIKDYPLLVRLSPKRAAA